MIDAAQRTHQAATATDPTSGFGISRALRAQSFTAALSSELSERATLDRNTQDSPANSPLGQQNVIRRDSVASTPASVASLPLTPNNAAPSTSSTTTGLAASGSASTTTPASFDDAYWAQQPAPVQQLRNIQDPTERTELATQLADQGYTIDVPIMVWGWDPQITTEARESLGYTWVPSALQTPVEVAPGVTFNGAKYNASDPPPGSIAV